MIKSLYIRDLAIIEKMHILFDRKLNIVSGETGSGKSIIIRALKYITGARFNFGDVRQGSKRAVVEGVFERDGEEFIVRRVFNASGNSRSFLNDEPVTLEALREQMASLTEIQGQHENQRLFDSRFHLKYLDSFAGHEALLSAVAESHQNWRHTQAKIADIREEIETRRKDAELRQFRKEEIEAAELQAGLDEAYSEELAVLSQAENILNGLKKSQKLLEAGDGGTRNSLLKAIRELENFRELKVEIASVHERLNSVLIEVDDILAEIRSISTGVRIDPRRISELSEKIAVIETLKRKYGGSWESVLKYYDELTNFEQESSDLHRQLEELEQNDGLLFSVFRDHCVQLRESRMVAARSFANTVMKNVAKMNLPSARFVSDLQDVLFEEANAEGADRCEFYFSANVGEDAQPLLKVASGGEMSRLMFAIKIALQGKDFVKSAVFDEIDTGISGSSAEKVARLILELSEQQQIVCVTHLPQIASKGKSHFKIFKEERDERTVVHCEKLDKNARIHEIAVMISSENPDEKSINFARQQIEG